MQLKNDNEGEKALNTKQSDAVWSQQWNLVVTGWVILHSLKRKYNR